MRPLAYLVRAVFESLALLLGIVAFVLGAGLAGLAHLARDIGLLFGRIGGIDPEDLE